MHIVGHQFAILIHEDPRSMNLREEKKELIKTQWEKDQSRENLSLFQLHGSLSKDSNSGSSQIKAGKCI